MRARAALNEALRIVDALARDGKILGYEKNLRPRFLDALAKLPWDATADEVIECPPDVGSSRCSAARWRGRSRQVGSSAQIRWSHISAQVRTRRAQTRLGYCARAWPRPATSMGATWLLN